MTRKEWDKHKSNGHCPICHKPKPDDGNVRCAECRADQRNHNKNFKEKWTYRSTYYLVIEGPYDPKNTRLKKALEELGKCVVKRLEHERVVE